MGGLENAAYRLHPVSGLALKQTVEKEESMAEKETEVAKREERQLARRDPFLSVGNPIQVLDRFADEMDRVFEDFGFGRGWLTPRFGRSGLRSPLRGAAADWE